MQFDLFADRGAPISSAMPNENGVYPVHDAETLSLPIRKKGWNGCNTADIQLLHVEQGWMVATHAYIDMFCGMGGPLSGKGGFHPNRASALNAGIAQLRRYFTPDRTWPNTAVVEAERAVAWLETVQ